MLTLFFFPPDTDGAPSDTSDTNSVVGVGGRKEDKGKKILIQIIHVAHTCNNDTIQIKDMFQIVAMWLQFSTEEYKYVGINKAQRRCLWEAQEALHCPSD